MGTNTQVNKQDNLCSVETSQSDVMESHKSLDSCPRAVPILVGQTTQPTGSFHFPGTVGGLQAQRQCPLLRRLGLGGGREDFLRRQHPVVLRQIEVI